MRKKKKPWYASRGYQHLDAPIGRVAARKMATSPAIVAKHSFLPFIHYIKRARRFSKKGVDYKERPIHYASHRDSIIYAYYAGLLSQRYESWITDRGLADCIIAYRQLGRSNIDFASEAFQQVRHRAPCTAMCFDIDGFFPSLDHKLLRNAICTVLGVTSLTEDWYAVFRSVTKYAWVERRDVVSIAGKSLGRASDGRAITIEQLHNGLRAGKLIKSNPDKHGIPQGSPISSVLANVYMTVFDMKIACEARKFGALYRRYSDDILLICPTPLTAYFRSFVEKEASALLLTLKAAKFEQVEFTVSGERVASSKRLQYLGFTFDGERIFLRDSSLSRFYRRMAVAIRCTGLRALKSVCVGKTSKMYKRSLYQSFSPRGRENFLTGYATKAAAQVGPNGIEKQTRRAPLILRRRISSIQRRFSLPT